MRRALSLLSLVGAAAGIFLAAAFSASGQATDAQGGAWATVEGAADTRAAGYRQTARLDAMRKAIEEVAGSEIRSHAISSYHQLVRQYNYIRANGLVQEVVEIDGGRYAGDVFIQRFRIRVAPAAVAVDLLEQGIDVEFLYDLVARPRIALAIVDEWSDAPEDSSSWRRGESQFSQLETIRYFKERHDGFTFMDLEMMRKDLSQTVDHVREARRNQFDLLVIGRTRSTLRQSATRETRNPWLAKSDDPQWEGKRHTFDSRIEWRVINVSTSETILTLQEKFIPGPEEGGRESYSLEEARAWSAQKLLESQLPKLFRSLIVYWNRQAFRAAYEVVFKGVGAEEAASLEAALGKLGADARASATMIGAEDGVLRFSIRSERSVSEIVRHLTVETGGRFTVVTARAGRIELNKIALSPPTIKVSVRGSSLSDAIRIESSLSEVQGVHSVVRERFGEGVVDFRVHTVRTSEELGLAMESSVPRIRVVDMTERDLTAEIW